LICATITQMKYLIILILLLLNPAAYAEEFDEWIPFYAGNKTIHLKFTDVINDKYTVNVLWTPDDGLQVGLNGPAIVQFVPIEPNYGAESFVIEYGLFHLPGSVLPQLWIETEYGDFEYDRSFDLNKTYTLKYSDLIDATSANSGNSVYRMGSGSAPFFFQDINYDGVKELVVVETAGGQKYTDEFYFYKLDGYKYLYKHFDLINTDEADVARYSDIDSSTRFDEDNKTIETHSIGGSCGGSAVTYKQQSDLEFHPIIYKKWNHGLTVEYGYVCTESIYDIVDGEGVLKSKSYSEMDGTELGTKYY